MISTASVAAVVVAAPSFLSLHTAHASHPPMDPRYRPCSVFVAPSTVDEHKLGLFAGIPHAPHTPLQVTTPQLLIEIFDANKNEWSPWMDFVFRGNLLLPSLAHDFERDLFLPGISSMFDCFEDEKMKPRLVNVVATSIDDDSREQQPQKIHRSTHATAGSYTDHSGFTYTVTRSLVAGQEIFPSYQNINTTSQHPTTPNDEHPPLSHEVLNYRSIEWLQANALCIDTLDVQQSSVPGIGRGAFAKYAVPIGQPIATTPIIQFDRSQMQRVAQLRDHHLFPNLVQRSRSGIEYHADHILQEQLLLNYCWSHPLSHVLLLPIGMGVQAINHYAPPKHTSSSQQKTSSPNAYLRWKNPVVFGTSPNNNSNIFLSQTAHQLLDQPASLAIGPDSTTQQLWVEVVALKAIEVGDEIFLDYGAEWQTAWDAHEAAYFSALHPDDDPSTYISAAEYLRDHHHRDRRPFPTVTENHEAVLPPLDPRLSPNLQTACFYRRDKSPGRDRNSSSEEEESLIVHFIPSVHASSSCLFPCSIIERHEERRMEEENPSVSSSSSTTFTFSVVDYYYTVHVYNRSGGTLSQEQECGTMPVEGARVSNVPAWALTWVDTPYSTDALMKQAFRHAMGVVPPDNGFWPASWMTKDPMPRGDFIHTPLAPGELQVIRWADTGAVVHPNAYRLGFDPHFQHTMLRYCRDMGIVEVMRYLTVKGNAIAASSNAYVTLAAGQNVQINKIRVSSQWFSPGEAAAHQHFLHALSVAGFDAILASIGTALGLDHLVVYQLTFIAVSHAAKGLIHVDFTNTQNKAFNVIIPLILANETGPELDLVSASDKDKEGNFRKGRYRYEPNVGSVVGDDAVHASSAADYRSSKEMRLAATIYIAEVTEDNVDSIVSHYNQAFPPQDRNLLLSWAGMHWNANPTKQLPSPPEDHILLVNNNANPFQDRLAIFQDHLADADGK